MISIYPIEVARRYNNPCMIPSRRDLSFIGSANSLQGQPVIFHSTLYGYRAMFSLLRHWNRNKGIFEVGQILNQMYWPEDAFRFSFVSKVLANAGWVDTQRVEYKSTEARVLVSSIAFVMSGWQVSPDDLQNAQSMIL